MRVGQQHLVARIAQGCHGGGDDAHSAGPTGDLGRFDGKSVYARQLGGQLLAEAGQPGRLGVESPAFLDGLPARFGYMDPQNIPALLPLIREADIERPLENEELSYFLSRIEIVLGHTPGMSRWRKRLFIATSQITADAAEVFQLPREQTLIVGSRIEL